MNKRQLGNKYEQVAQQYLLKRAYRIIKQNYYTPHGELDIIAVKENELYFIEVKYNTYSQEHALRKISQTKKKRMYTASLYYLAESNIEQIQSYYSLISINKKQLIFIKNILSTSDF